MVLAVIDVSRLLLEARRSVADELSGELAERGYVRRVADPSDTRAKLVRLTSRGRTAAAQCRRAVQAIEQRTRRRLGDRVYDIVVDALQELAEPLEDE